LISFKNELFDSPELTADNQLPAYEFKRLRNQCEFEIIRQKMAGAEDLILQETCCEDNMIDLNRFCNLVDLYVYLPQPDKKINGRLSKEMHYIMSSNFKGEASAQKSQATE